MTTKNEKSEGRRALKYIPGGMPRRKALKYLNECICIVEAGADTWVVEYGTNERMSKRQARERFSDVCIQMGRKTIPAFSLWDSVPAPEKRKYHGFVFDPSNMPETPLTYFNPENPRPYNLWRGWNVEPKKGDCNLFLDLIRDVICAGNSKHYDYLIKDLAHMFQRPWEKSEHAVVLKGPQGTGKSFFTSTIGHLINPVHVLNIMNPALVTGRFSAHFANILLAIFNEAHWAGDKTAIGQLKSLITDKTLTVEQKFQNPFTIRNLARFMFTSNEAWVVHADRDERRFFVLDVSDIHAKDQAYFAAIADQLQDGGYEALLYFLLRKVDLAKFDLRHPPATQGLLDQKIESADPTEQFWIQETSDPNYLEICEQQGFVFKEDVFNAYRSATIASKYRDASTKFWKRTRAIIGPIGTMGKRARVKGGSVIRTVRLPEIEEARANLLKYFEI